MYCRSFRLFVLKLWQFVVSLLLTYVSWFRVEHRTTTTFIQSTQFWLVLLSPIPSLRQPLLQHQCISASLLRTPTFSFLLDLRTFPFAYELHSRACLVMLVAGLLSVWPIHPYLRFLISVSIENCCVMSHRCWCLCYYWRYFLQLEHGLNYWKGNPFNVFRIYQRNFIELCPIFYLECSLKIKHLHPNFGTRIWCSSYNNLLRIFYQLTYNETLIFVTFL